MGRSLRHYEDPEKIYFVTNRCLEERFFFRPSKEVNAIVSGCLVRSVKRYGVDMFAFVFMSNHFHMLVQARELNLADFMEHFQGNVAKKLNILHKRRGTFFAGRYNPQPVLDDAALIEKYAYIATNPCASHLVDRVLEWPGLISHRNTLSQTPITGTWTEGSRRKRTITASFHLAPLPSIDRPGHFIDPLILASKVTEREDALRHERKAAKRRVLGARRVRRMRHTDRPKHPKRTPQPHCHTTCSQTRKRFVQHIRALTDAYRAELHRWRRDPTHTLRVPIGMFPPGHQRPARS